MRRINLKTQVVIYARFSSHSQTEQSIEGQLKVCYEFAKRNDYNVIGEYIDRAISGKDAEKRPDFQRMIADSAKRQFNAILVYQLDRFSRNRYDSAIYKAKLRKYGVRVLSARYWQNFMSFMFPFLNLSKKNFTCANSSFGFKIFSFASSASKKTYSQAFQQSV